MNYLMLTSSSNFRISWSWCLSTYFILRIRPSHEGNLVIYHWINKDVMWLYRLFFISCHKLCFGFESSFFRDEVVSFIFFEYVGNFWHRISIQLFRWVISIQHISKFSSLAVPGCWYVWLWTACLCCFIFLVSYVLPFKLMFVFFEVQTLCSFHLFLKSFTFLKH